MLRTLSAASVATLMAAAPVWAQEASISVDDQKVKGKQVTIEKVVIPVDGWVVIHPSDAKGQVIELAKNSRFEEIAGAVPGDLLPVVAQDLQLAFVDAIHNTFAVSALSCLLGVGAAFLVRNQLQQSSSSSQSELEEDRIEDAMRAAD